MRPVVALFMFMLLAGEVQAHEQIRIVGSSTVFPFAAEVAHRFGDKESLPIPIVESTGTGAGIERFCSGTGAATPDIVNASRTMTPEELALCRRNNVTPIEVKIGYDGIVLAESKEGPPIALKLEQIFLALAREVPVSGKMVANPYQKWSDIDPSLPDLAIRVLGPPESSGTRDSFVAMAMTAGAERIRGLRLMKLRDLAGFQAIVGSIRDDGAYISAGENDHLIARNVEERPDSLGIFGFNFLSQHSVRLRGIPVEGVPPDYETIDTANYPLTRPLYFYIKKEHAANTLGLDRYVLEFTRPETRGAEGYLVEGGLVPLPRSVAPRPTQPDWPDFCGICACCSEPTETNSN